MTRRQLAVGLLSIALGLGLAGCSSGGDTVGESTDLSEVGPDLARLEAEVDALHQQVAELQRRLAELDPSSVTTTTTSSLR